MKKNLIIYLLFFLLSIGFSNAQDLMKVNGSDGESKASFVLNDIERMVFSEYSMSIDVLNQESFLVEFSGDEVFSFEDFIAYFNLMVVNGSGSGDYVLGDTVSVVADTAPKGKIFDQWIGHTSVLLDSMAASTSVIMPADSVMVTALYKEKPAQTYVLTVVEGTGSGSYQEGDTVEIMANATIAEVIFVQWMGDVQYVVDTLAFTTKVIMPADSVILTAKYSGNTAINELLSFEKSIALYPNPATDIVNVHLNEACILDYTIYDMQGRIILTQNDFTTVQSDYSIDLSSFENGVYHCQFSRGNDVAVIRIIKQ